MTQPAAPQQPAQPTQQPQINTEQETLRISLKIAPVLKDEDPHIVTLALLRVAAATALHTRFTPEQLAGSVAHYYHESKAAQADMLKDPRVLQMLGIKPGDPMPADLEDRIKRLMEQAQSGTLQPPPQQPPQP